ncbi:EF-hand domain-containing protein [Streptomyces sp. NBRC 110611]|uniref:EF-hand domain-containing protein n=1 Tax=Streptomyces sp. NBRC 110611 TaxID=1621259 RepID=UPI0015EF27E4|nr:EF-hand domain-containing protein [Streptomyces sp. NBRC 110611]
MRAVRETCLQITGEDAAAFVAAADTDGDQLISQVEFDAVRTQEVPQDADEYADAFAAFDVDESGFLSLDEMERFAALCGCPEDSAAELMAEADNDGDRKLSRTEFTALMKALNN